MAEQLPSIQQGQIALVVKVCAIAGLILWGVDVFQELAIRFQFWASPKRHPMLDIDGEAGIYTWLSSTVLLLNALALFLVASRRAAFGDRFARHWLGLAIGFVGLSADESVRIHETINKLINARLHLEGAFHFGWVIPALLICLVVGLAYASFLAALPARVRTSLLLAGALYVGGAVGMEMLSGALFEGDTRLFGYRMLVTVEEGGELSGALLLLAALSRFWTPLMTSATLEAPEPRQPRAMARAVREPRPL